MRSSALANRPRGPRPGGFFEIWFLVVFAPRGGRAWWLRYTTFVPVRGSGGAPRATLWAAAFDAAAAAPASAIMDVRPLAAYSAGDGFAVRIGDAVLTDGTAHGGVAARVASRSSSGSTARASTAPKARALKPPPCA